MIRKFEKEIAYPKIIYKYTPINAHLYQHLTNNEIWFSNPQDFNDPYDCNIGFNQREYTEDEIRAFWEKEYKGGSEEIKEQRIKEWLMDQSLIESFMFNPVQNFLRKKAISCFTTKNDDPLMWSHYGDSHKGVCVGYSSELLTKTFGQHEWVTYTKEFPPTNILKISEFVSTIMCIKNDCWSYENEIRVFQKGKGAYPYPREATKTIIFGLNTPLNQIHSLMNLMHQLKYDGVQYFQVVLKRNEFKIHFVTLTYSPKTNSVIRAGISEDSKKIQLSILNPYIEAEKNRQKEEGIKK